MLRVVHLPSVLDVDGLARVLRLNHLTSVLRLDHLTRVLGLAHLAGVLGLDRLAGMLGLNRLTGAVVLSRLGRMNARMVLVVRRLAVVSWMHLLCASIIHRRRRVRRRCRRRHFAFGRRDADIHRPQLRPLVWDGMRRVRRVLRGRG